MEKFLNSDFGLKNEVNFVRSSKIASKNLIHEAKNKLKNNE
jgi:hypothetical protein